MKAYIFPGQGAQFSGMGLDLYEKAPEAQHLFEDANEILGFHITDIMFEGTAEALKETKVTQPAIFLHSVILAKTLGESFKPDMVAGHSLGEFSALVANGALTFEDGLRLVSQRALAMQKACELQPSTMAAVLGLEDSIVEQICNDTKGIVVAANYNCPGQLVISGEIDAINRACESLKEAGARRALVLPVGGAFHSPMMEPAREELAAAVSNLRAFARWITLHVSNFGWAVKQLRSFVCICVFVHDEPHFGHHTVIPELEFINFAHVCCRSHLSKMVIISVLACNTKCSKESKTNKACFK